MISEPLPRRVRESEDRRALRERLSRSSLGCPLGLCEHLVGFHAADEWLSNGGPVNPRCKVWGCDCGAQTAGPVDEHERFHNENPDVGECSGCPSMSGPRWDDPS